MLYVIQDDTFWLHLIELAHERKTEVRVLLDNGDQKLWEASSYSNPGHWHVIDLDVGSHGVRYSCECLAYRDGNRPCNHSAAVLEAMEFITLPAPVAEPAEPSPEVTKLKGQRALALINDDDSYDAICREIAAIESGS